MGDLKAWKRPLALALAFVMLWSPASVSALAAEPAAEFQGAGMGQEERTEGTVSMSIRGDAFQQKNLNVFGKMHHSITYYSLQYGAEILPSFCLQPGRKLPNHSVMNYTRYDISNGGSMPYVGTLDRFKHMYLAYEWTTSENFFVMERYAMVQVYIWGCLAGYEDNWTVQEQAARQLQAVMPGADVMGLFESMRSYIVDGMAEEGNASSGLPAWSGTEQRMELKDGGYELTLDISACPQLASTTWTFPGDGWSWQLAQDGKSITFRYEGAGEPSGTVQSGEIPGASSRYFLYLLTPVNSSLQTQFGWLERELDAAVASFSVNSQDTQTSELALYRHSETFESNYTIDLEKYCAETNQPLEGTTFNVWEAFDFSQVNEEGYTEGEPDGTTGQIYVNCMSPQPEEEYLCDTITTDGDGYASHTDVRSYAYSKTYCLGHPAPEWVECDHEAEEECSCEEENDRLREQWQAEQELCAATCDFHAQNDDEEDRQEDTSARDDMLADRDETYENFISLEYSYWLEEKTARTGYILHGEHKDDEEIETVVLVSAQAEGDAQAGGRGRSASASEQPAVLKRGAEPERLTGQRTYSYALPGEGDRDLDALRTVLAAWEEEEKEPQKQTEKEQAEERPGKEPDAAKEETNGAEEEPSEETDAAKEEPPEEPEAAGEESGGADEEPDMEDAGLPEESDAAEEEPDTAGENQPEESDAAEEEVSGEPDTGKEPAEEDTSGGKDDSQESENTDSEQGSEDTGSGGAGEGGAEASASGGEGSSFAEDGSESGEKDDGESSAENGSESNEEAAAVSSVQTEARASVSRHMGERQRLLTAAAGKENGRAIESATPAEAAGAGNEDEEEALAEDMPEEASEEDPPEEEPIEDFPEDEDTPSIETYQYIRKPVFVDFGQVWEAEEKGGEGLPKLSSLFSRLAGFFTRSGEEEDDSGEVTVSLPAFMDDDLPAIDTSGYGDTDTVLYTFKVWDHRTEGEIYINKRDLELVQADAEESYGRTQGDATLEGAVYGLFATEDILHPDGKSGVIYHQNDLAAVASTDENGDAAFLAFTEKPGTVLGDDGNIQAPEGRTGPENLYDGSSITSSAHGFGTITYPDNLGVNGSQWIGRPLLLGSYYIMELSRSEGYELSVTGIDLEETNRGEEERLRLEAAGQAWVSRGLGYNTDMEADGSWNDFTVETYQTKNGYDITVSGYPEGTSFYRMDVKERTETERVPVNGRWQQKTDGSGNPVWQTAEGGEYKIGPDGNPIPASETATESESGERLPQGETLRYQFRTAPRPSGSASPEDLSKWELEVDSAYLEEQVNGMLGQMGYREASEAQGSPWAIIPLPKTNGEAAEEILDWLTERGFYDCAGVEQIYEEDGTYYARIYYDYSGGSEENTAFYEPAGKRLFVRKSAVLESGGGFHYWISYEEGEYHLSSRTASVSEKRAIEEAVPEDGDLEALIQTVYQTAYETYEAGELILDREGNPIPVMEYVYDYEEQPITYYDEELIPVTASWDAGTGTYTLRIENTVDWENVQTPIQETFRAVTAQSSISYEGQEMPYSDYLIQAEGAAVSVHPVLPEIEAGTYVRTKTLLYPGQTEAVQDGGTGKAPIQVSERPIKQAVWITKDISQISYEGVNTYGSIHNDPFTALMGLFTGRGGSQGGKLLDQFTFKAYLKSNLENIYVDGEGKIISEDISWEAFPEAVQPILRAPESGGRRLLETKEDGTYDYEKFFDAMYGAAEKSGEGYSQEVLEQFARDHLDVEAYKQEILAAEPDLNSDKAYDRALERAAGEAEAYFAMFDGLEERLAIPWDRAAGGGPDGNPFTLQCNEKDGADDYYGSSILLPYGTYVIVEQIPEGLERELANRHYESDFPKELTLPFVPDIRVNENTGQTETDYHRGSPYFWYSSGDSPEDLIRKYKIRFNEESHVIEAHGHKGDFTIRKYGDGERAGTMDGVFYSGNETASGEAEVRDQVPTMTGMGTAVDGKYAAMLVPWSVLMPTELTKPQGSGADFNYTAYAQADFENRYYSSRLRIEKLDEETGESIIHDGAIFKIYAAKRDVEKTSPQGVRGTGRVLFGEAVDAEGNPVADGEGRPILYPRVGESNSSTDDLPIRLDEEGIPLYDESQLIRQTDREGNERGIFMAYSTLQEVEIDGQMVQRPVGYIETYAPLGAGAYVLVEVEAPAGYVKSRPVAFEIYSDGVSYYEEERPGDGTSGGWERKEASRYQYAIPVTGETGKYETETVSQIPVQDYPIRVEIRKAEDGDSLVGNENGLLKTDAQGSTEESGGFEGELTVNDAGDHIIYQVRGRRERLEERGDVRDIAYDQETQEWYGYVTKAMDQYGEQIIEGTEQELKSMEGVKPLYERDGTFTGKGIRFTVPVSGARLELFAGIELEETAPGQYKGVEVLRENGRVVRIRNSNTGAHKEIQVIGREETGARLSIWDAVPVENEPVDLYFFDLEDLPRASAIPYGMGDRGQAGFALWENADTGELSVLDENGNPICHVDGESGMAYVYDDYGRKIAYVVDETGEKQLVSAIQVLENGGLKTIYEDKRTVDDENGLPVYYEDGHVTVKEESWVTDASTDPYGSPETEGASHMLARLPVGAYILEEREAPLEQGYIRAEFMGLVLEDTEEVQKFFLQDAFTRTAFAKLDVRTQREIEGAQMTLYKALLDESGEPILDAQGRYQKGEAVAGWVSGYAYDDDGNQIFDGEGNPISTTEPHWIDHLPVGRYVLEETVCPYAQGYVQSETVNVDVLETGHVQSFAMEDDFTALEIRKYDTKNEDVLYEDSAAVLGLYRAALDAEGNPQLDADGTPLYREEDLIFTFRSATYRDGQDVAATGRLTPDAGGNNPIVKYDYQYQPIPNTVQGRWYYTERGTTRLEYLPVGSYVLAEEETPSGYATAAPILITLEDVGHLTEIQSAEMGDSPLRLSVSKEEITGGKEVHGARLAIYPVDEEGKPEEEPLILRQPTENGEYQDVEAVWVSGMDGVYEKEDAAAGNIPEGSQIGDLKPHLIEYIPAGDYILREETAPYGFLQAVDIAFTVTDTGLLQTVTMEDEIPDGVLILIKSDADNPEKKLAGAEFVLTNQTLGVDCQTVVTGENGEAVFDPVPIGCVDSQGNFAAYTYVCTETKAAPDHMLTLEPFPFQFEYADEKTAVIHLTYEPANDSNRVETEKRLGGTDELLEGALLRLERKEGELWETAEEWTTGKQPHLAKGLAAGEYRLVEVKAPEGVHVLAEPISFTIEDGMTEVPRIVMENFSVIVKIEKTSDSAGTLLGGARLQLIRKDSGQTVGEWTSRADEGQTFYGLEPGAYIIRELEAPSGYERGEDREIQILDSTEIQTFAYQNTEIVHRGGGGGGGDDGPEPSYLLFKKTDLGGNVLAGAEFTVYDARGQVIERAVSGPDGTIRIARPGTGTYTMAETRTPEGYAVHRNVYSFTVDGPGAAKGVYAITNSRMEVPIYKKDGTTGEPLEGALLAISWQGESGEEVFEGRTGSDGILMFYPPGAGTYTIREKEAPEGYEISQTVYSFTVDERGRALGNTVVYNFKTPQIIGRITGSYTVKDRFGDGIFRSEDGRLFRTGDNAPVWEAAACAVCCLAAAGVCLYLLMKRDRKPPKGGPEGDGCQSSGSQPGRGGSSGAKRFGNRDGRSARRGRSRRKTIKKWEFFLVLVLLAAGLSSGTARAETGKALPSETAASEVKPRAAYISQRVEYTDLEGEEQPPERAWIPVTDEETGREEEVLLPLTGFTWTNERWSPDFSMELTLKEQEADYYLLGGTLIRAEELLKAEELPRAEEIIRAEELSEAEASGHMPAEQQDLGERILMESGLDTAAYRILSLTCEEAPDGSLQILAEGERRLRDCVAVYEGTVAEGGTAAYANASHANAAHAGAVHSGPPSSGMRLPDAASPGRPGGGGKALFLVMGVLAAGTAFLFEGNWLRGRSKNGKQNQNQNQNKNQNRNRRTLLAAGVCVFLAAGMGSGAVFLGYIQSYRQDRKLYADLRDLAYEEEKAGEQSLEEAAPPDIDEASLRRLNPDYRLWLRIPGTDIDYPIVQGEDPLYYLDHAFDRSEQAAGALFIDSGQTPLLSFNTVVYGHNQKDGSMFGQLKRYADRDFWEENPVLSIYSQGRWLECPVFSCRIVGDNDGGPCRSPQTPEEQAEYLAEAAEASLYDTGIRPGEGDRVLTLYTCHGSGQRMVVHARLG